MIIPIEGGGDAEIPEVAVRLILGAVVVIVVDLPYDRPRTVAHLLPQGDSEDVAGVVVGGLAFVLTVILFNAFRSGAGLGPIPSATLANLLATVFAFLGNKFWAFRHRKGNRPARETLLFFFFNGIGILITDGVVAAAEYGLGLKGTFSDNVANVIGIGLATLFRLYCYRRWVFLYADGDAPAAEQLEPETSGT